MGFLKRLFGGGGGEDRRRPEPRHDLALLARVLETDPDALAAFRPEYRTFEIPKKGGGRRTIAAPLDETRFLQRRILARVLARLRSHACATGFEKGLSVVVNALPHVGQAVVVRMDIVDFFPSITERRVRDFFRGIGWDDAAADVLTALTTWRGALPQGAPTSPRLSNLVNVRLDARLDGLAARGLGPAYPAVYTRYADDMTFSTAWDEPGLVGNLIRHVKGILAEEGYRLHQRKKLQIRRRHQRQIVTGIVVNEKAALPRETRRWLRAVEHRLATKGEATLSERELAGWRAWLHMVETQRERYDDLGNSTA